MDGCDCVVKLSQHIHADENFMLLISSKLVNSYYHFTNKISQHC